MTYYSSSKSRRYTWKPLLLALFLSLIHPQRVPWWDNGDCSGEGQAASPSEGNAVSMNDAVGGTCGRRAWAAGGGQRVVSLSLYGDRAEYWHGLDTLLTQVGRTKSALKAVQYVVNV